MSRLREVRYSRSVNTSARVRVLVLFSTVAALLATVVASGARAADGADRHPQRGAGAIAAPPGVPAAYVFTHSGWFHPSCVVRVRSDEVVEADGVIRGKGDGAPHFALAPCSYARFDLGGRLLSAGAAPPVHAAPAPAIYDGYIVYYEYDGSIAVGSTLVTDEIVPPAPTNVADQDIAFFNDILTSAGGGDILQPVLDFNGETSGKWSIESEHCCISNNDMQTTPIVVAPGDQIRGTVTGSGCATTGVCSAWTVTTADVTSGRSTTLNTTAPNGVPSGVSPGSLETYGVMSCDMFPVGGETTFTSNMLTDPGGNVQTLKYRLIALDDVAPEVPTNCGYGGRSSGNDFTLIYGTVPSGADAGTSTGGAGAAAGGHGGGAGGGGQGGATGKAGSGGAAGKAGAAGQGGVAGRAETGGEPGAGGSPGIAGAGGGAGRVGTTGSGGVAGIAGTGPSGGAGAGGDEVSAPTSGCSCSLAFEGNGRRAPFVLASLLLPALVRRRRRSR
jgi:MYXO-CTERM domain-containing protein